MSEYIKADTTCDSAPIKQKIKLKIIFLYASYEREGNLQMWFYVYVNVSNEQPSPSVAKINQPKSEINVTIKQSQILF
jgi:hypothetical protein